MRPGVREAASREEGALLPQVAEAIPRKTPVELVRHEVRAHGVDDLRRPRAGERAVLVYARGAFADPPQEIRERLPLPAGDAVERTSRLRRRAEHEVHRADPVPHVLRIAVDDAEHPVDRGLLVDGAVARVHQVPGVEGETPVAELQLPFE